MRRYGWRTRSSLWFVFLVALGLKAATSTWSNFKRGSAEYHRRLADECERLSARHNRRATQIEDELSSRSISDPAVAAERRETAMMWAESARSSSLQAASLVDKAEACERSPVGWIFLQYETSRNPPDLPVHHVSGAKPPWLKSGTFLHSALVTLAHVDFLGLACLALAIVAGRRFARARGVGGQPPAPTAP